MRDRSGWHRRCSPQQLTEVWPTNLGSFRSGDLLDVELGLYLLQDVTPTRTAADVWPLLGGYPYSEAFGDVRTDEQRLRVLRARHYLWDLRRRHAWREALSDYLAVPQQLRGYDLDGPDDVPRRREPSRAAQRFKVFEDLLSTAPAFSTRSIPLAEAGEHTFRVQDRTHSVVFEEELLSDLLPRAHALDAPPAGRGEPVDVTWEELEKAADAMDAVEAAAPDGPRNAWAGRLQRVKLLVRDESSARFAQKGRLTVDRLLHLVGMVGAGKSTIRDILTYHAVTQTSRRVTIVVGDVAETLAVVEQFGRLGVRAAPILGHSTRERNINRLHRRTATAGTVTMLGHDHAGFAYLSSACPVDVLRGLEARRPLGIREAPCLTLFTVPEAEAAEGDPLLDDESPAVRDSRRPKPQRRLCPLWNRCPRHRGARDLVDAQVWVATPAGLVHSSVPQHQHDEQLRYLELACRVSDLIIVDEADRVQMQLDTAFAPASTLVGKAPNSWFDEVAVHKFQQMARDGRLQLSARDVDDWTNAVNTVSAATDRLYALLVKDDGLRRWISVDYFSAFTLHNLLLDSWFPGRKEGERPPAAAGTLDAALGRFRDDPLHEQHSDADDDEVTRLVNTFVHLTLELLHAPQGARTRGRLRETLTTIVSGDTGVLADMELQARRFEFTLILSALHSRLDFMTTLWPRVEAALNLESASNVLSRRPPKDYEAVIPESPMGNVLGFQFRHDDQERDGDRSGELRFFHCNGVGRELLMRLGDLCAVDGRPGPHVLLMSATSWAGTSSRYHVHAEVGAVLRPRDEEVEAVLGTEFRKEFLYWPGGDQPKPLRLSGCDPEERPQALLHMLHQLAVPDRSLPGSMSMLDAELDEIDDPERRRILLLVGSYDEARRAAEYLNQIPEWNGRVTQLVSDDADADTAWTRLPEDTAARTLPRGDVKTFPSVGGDLLVAPLLAVERGHNIVLRGGKAAIGTVYFLARPHPRPDDISLAIQSINDWAVRQLRDTDGSFAQGALAAATPDRAAVAFRSRARGQWNRFLTRKLAWSSLRDDEKVAFTWDQLVVMWQVIGRLVRGGVPARVVFVDAAFSPREAGFQAADTPDTSLLASMREVLAPYFEDDGTPGREPAPIDKSLVRELYEPLYRALADMG
ncbi:signal recognition particle [Streptomyces sp. 15-116A]|uniref:pPIWI_RE_Z domain-containing protein n=1 Tax=Streptomyces sp. 15-116A TaxID=2259035 RepID=UPI0021B3E223|nr:signal recognition particle [Streptomyces sp. 15-116A]MCT7351843.1 signal recognition particle [Streptomyces sp. 15-116A]